ncbi:MAG: NAD(P) transhydrogenase subunit alpha [Actinomycetota bacterium]
MRLGVLRENRARERRVALTPTGAAALIGDGHEVIVEVGAGLRAGFGDEAYRDTGATVAQRSAVIGDGGVITGVHGPTEEDIGAPEWSTLGADHVLLAQHDPLWRPARAAALGATGATVVSLELIPRTTKAQSMDVLSSAATVAGYEAALLAAAKLQRMLPMLMTAAGTVPPSRFVVLGAGVAGLQAIATARRLGAVVEGYDIRPAAMEQIQSLGAKAIELTLDAAPAEGSGGYAAEQTEELNRRQNELLTPYLAEADAVITTAAVPGAPSPELITTPMVEAMGDGSVIIDLAAERGGNCRLTVPDEEITHDGVLILGPTDLASRAAATASQMFSNNVISLLRHLAPAGDEADESALTLDLEDEITDGVVVATGGTVRHPRVAERLAAEETEDSP